MEQPQPPLPKPPADEENLRRLRQEAAERMRREAASYPPAPVYGGPPISRRWTLRGIVTLVASAVAALVAGLWGYRKVVTPVYGGPPNAVYGGPPPPQPTPPQPGPANEPPK
ncbi:MAG TPA: hypothetical protein VKU19_08685 [Bryobacteraceae bacterium]|nr:hypothetical protein [Bryobacteraceae bacterium]